jgi:hypothetical protein
MMNRLLLCSIIEIIKQIGINYIRLVTQLDSRFAIRCPS